MTNNRFKSILFAAVLLLGVLAINMPAQDVKTVAPESVGLSSERLERLTKAMQEDIDQKVTGGIIVLIARHGSIAYHKAFGMADIESGKKMQTDHLFRLYSMTKPVTSVALLTLFEEGKFQLSDPLEKYIPAFKNVKVFVNTDEKGRTILEEPKRKITIQDVFRHTAGFSYGFGGTPVEKCYQQAGIDFGKMDTLKELVDKMATCPLLYQPGEQWVYSVAHDVQAYLVEYFSGMRFDKYVQSKIIQPLAMKDAVFGIPKEYVSRYTTNYGPKKEGGLEPIDKPQSSNYARYTDHPFGGLSLSSTTMDYYRFAQMLLNGGKLGNVRILGKKTVELMTANNLPPQIPDIGMGGGTGYGLGVSSLINPALSGNLGSQGNFGWGGAAATSVVIDPKEDLVALYFTQLMPNEMSMIGRFQTLVYQAIID
ncbi:MAG: beta-lactamase family protein [Acidobacteria bacterium]|nr:beta-lactamase family protein [Acidobacteriota bacterium]